MIMIWSVKWEQSRYVTGFLCQENNTDVRWKILPDLSFNINFHETSLGNVNMKNLKTQLLLKKQSALTVCIGYISCHLI